ncbi:MAG: O-antigen ligase family protein [Acidobacteria bacterium]|jgi:O-antigen ligase|nr:O-antigen ligase family protein [Acidobacteriota bacterium]
MNDAARAGGSRPAAAASLAWAAAALAVASALAVAWPPEVHPEAGPLVALLLAAGLLAAPGRLPPAAPLAALAFAAFNLAISIAPGRSLETAARLALPAGALGLGLLLGRARFTLPLAGLGAVGAGLGGLAVVQRAGLLALEAGAARELGLPALVVARLAENRPFATHLVPAALAGALVLTLAALLALAARGASWRWVGPGLALAGAGLVATGSLGGLVGLAAGALVAIPWRSVARRRAGWLGLAALLAAAAALVALRPGPVFELSRPDHPLALRAGNWRGGALVALRQPVAGSGLGSFASLYPAVRRPQDVETLYAHDSWLQLAGEGGLPALVLLAAAAWLLVRRARAGLPPDQRWALAGTAAFAAHNLVDFTAYLPGVAVPAMALAALAFSRVEPSGVSETDPGAPVARGGAATRFGRSGNAFAALALAGAAVVLGGDALARRGLERAEEAWRAAVPARDAGAPEPVPAPTAPAAARAALAAAGWAPFSSAATARAAMLALAAAPGERDVRGAATALAARLARRDPESPAGWRLLGEAALLDGRAGDAWRYLGLARARHPADRALAVRFESLESALRGAGMLERPLAYGGASPAPRAPRSATWEIVLLGVWLAAAALVALRCAGPAAPAPPEALALAALVLLAPWGEGSALPGPLFGRAALLTAGLLAALWPRPDPAGSPGADDPRGWPAGLLWTAPLALWAAFSAARSPEPAAARDGLLALLWVLVALSLSWRVAARRPGWPRALVTLTAVSAAAAAALAALQRAALAAGLEPASWPPPFGLSADGRPAADFLHAGHLGTWLVAAGLALAGSALPGAGPPGEGERLATRRFAAGALLGAVGLAAGARASLLALAAGGAVLAFLSGSRAARRAALALAGGGLALGATAVLWRFAGGDPHAWTRLSIWRAALGALPDRPLAGFGPGGFAPLAPTYAFPDPGPIARFGRAFSGPHSDLLGLLLALGVVGAALALLALAPALARARTALRAATPDRAWLVGLAAGLAALAAHALVDDLFGARPAVALTAALFLGALAGRAVPPDAPRTSSVALRAGLTVAALVALLAGEAWPWAADRARRAGDPVLAAALDPPRAAYEIEAARAAAGPPARRLADALDHTTRAELDAPRNAATRAEAARVLQAACLGPLPTEDTCRAALGTWQEALARRPSDVQARRARARLLAATGDPAAAREELERALEDEPNYLGARLDLARVLSELGDETGAEAALAETRRRIAALEGARPDSAWSRQLLTLAEAERQVLRDGPLTPAPPRP